jgi:hypothetical protein
MQQWASVLRQVAMNANQTFEPMLRLRRELDSALRDISEAVGRPSRQWAELAKRASTWTESINAKWDEIGEALKKLPARQREAVMTLAANGWYLDPEMSFPELTAIEQRFKSGEVDQANEDLCAYFEAQLDDIVMRVSNAYPKRARILAQAAAAHRRGDYALTPPVFLAQADGICAELVGAQLYKGENKKPALGKYLKPAPPDSLRGALLTPLIESTPLTAGPQQRTPGSMNRHAILHGESTDYDSRITSCRALSLLSYVSWILAPAA